MAVKGKTIQKTITRLEEPKQYKVIMHNDDFTTAEFVVWVLMDLFHKPQPEAHQIMLNVHHRGIGVVGVYPYDIARTKTQEALRRARAQGFPFNMTIEPE